MLCTGINSLRKMKFYFFLESSEMGPIAFRDFLRNLKNELFIIIMISLFCRWTQSLRVLVIIFICSSRWIQASLIPYTYPETKMEIFHPYLYGFQKSFCFISRQGGLVNSLLFPLNTFSGSSWSKYHSQGETAILGL